MKDDRSEDQVISEVRSHKLAGLIWNPIWAEFDRTHDVKPTETEIDELYQGHGGLHGQTLA